MSVRRGHAGRVDNSQGPIATSLRGSGMTVQSIAIVGNGVPDLLVGFRGDTYLVECKTDGRPLTLDELKWTSAWNGMPVIVASTPYEAYDAIVTEARERGRL